MKQSLPAIKYIGCIPCSVLSPNIMEKHLAGMLVGIFPIPTAIQHYGSAECEAESEFDNNSYIEKTVLRFTTTDEIKQHLPLAFVVTDVENHSWIIGTKEAPFPIIAVTKSIKEDTNIFEVKVTFTRKKSLIPCVV